MKPELNKRFNNLELSELKTACDTRQRVGISDHKERSTSLSDRELNALDNSDLPVVLRSFHADLGTVRDRLENKVSGQDCGRVDG